MTTTTVYPAIGSDDANWAESVSAFDSTITTLLIGDYSSAGYGNVNALIRFALSVPQGSTINSAVLRVRSASNEAYTTCAVRIRAIDAASPAAPTTYAGAEGATRTTAYVNWTVPAFSSGVQYSTPDLTSILQELVDSYSITAVVIYLEDNGSANNRLREFYAYENGSNLPELYVDYTEPTAAAGMGADLQASGQWIQIF